MEFNLKKLPSSAAVQLRRVPFESIEPYSLIWAPAYVLMRRNRKFVAVKAPMDFFTPDDLARLKPFREIHFSPFVDCLEPFVRTAAALRRLFEWKPPDPQRELPLPPYELSDAVIRTIGPMWSKSAAIEPYYLGIFAEEVCGPLESGLLLEARERSVKALESGILLSSWAVFLGLHLGYCDRGFLRRLRARAFEMSVAPGVIPGRPLRHDGTQGEATAWPSDIDEVVYAASIEMPKLIEPEATISWEGFRERYERVFQKLTSRLNRIEREFIGGVNERRASG